MHNSIGTQKTIETNTVTLEDTPSCNPFITQNQLTVIEDMPDQTTKSEIDERNIAVQKAENVSVKKGRRRLLSINENSQLCSISPVEERKCTPKQSTSAKRNKRLKKELPKRRLMHPKNNTNSVKQDIVSNRMSDSDCDIPKNREKEKKKLRKPKKIISKKIIVKKFADENVLNILEGNKRNKEDCLKIENRDSLDDFVKCRTISSQWNRQKSQKIVIVTTGLSKG